jgi:hypothetical protein
MSNDQGKSAGFGNIRPLGVRNIFIQGGQVVPYTLRWQRFVDVDFTKNQRPYILPYQTLTFWTGAWLPDEIPNITNFVHLQKMSTGVIFLQSGLTIELLAVTRERLLQQGSTNTTTYDFESGECM